MKVKICGITRRRDAELAAALGAWAVGFVFWPGSPRCVDAETARALASTVPPTVARVGVFANQPAEHVVSIARIVGLSAVQLHGDESPAYAGTLGMPVIKAVALSQAAAPASETWPGVTLLVDGRVPHRLAEGGRTADWNAAARLAARRPIVLAGGLRPDNVRRAVDLVRPYAVDVSSGVESAPGVKDEELMRAFFEQATTDQHPPAAQGGRS